MHPILFKLGPLTLHSYGFFMALGVGLGALVPLPAGQNARASTRPGSSTPRFTS